MCRSQRHRNQDLLLKPPLKQNQSLRHPLLPRLHPLSSPPPQLSNRRNLRRRLNPAPSSPTQSSPVLRCQQPQQHHRLPPPLHQVLQPAPPQQQRVPRLALWQRLAPRVCLVEYPVACQGGLLAGFQAAPLVEYPEAYPVVCRGVLQVAHRGANLAAAQVAVVLEMRLNLPLRERHRHRVPSDRFA